MTHGAYHITCLAAWCDTTGPLFASLPRIFPDDPRTSMRSWASANKTPLRLFACCSQQTYGYRRTRGNKTGAPGSTPVSSNVSVVQSVVPVLPPPSAAPPGGPFSAPAPTLTLPSLGQGPYGPGPARTMLTNQKDHAGSDAQLFIVWGQTYLIRPPRRISLTPPRQAPTSSLPLLLSLRSLLSSI